MFIKDRGLILRQTPLPGKGNMIQLWMAREGSVSAVVYPGKKNGVAPAALKPLQLFDIELQYQVKSKSYIVKELKCLDGHTDIQFFNDAHLSVYHIMYELAWRVLRDMPGNLEVFEILNQHLKLLNLKNENAILTHISFLAAIIGCSGIQPLNTSEAKSTVYLNIKQGVYQEAPCAELFVSKEDTMWFEKVIQQHSNVFQIPKALRKTVFNTLLEYYSWHVPAFGKLQSLDIIRELF